MAQRPVFLPDPSVPGLVREEMVTFTWHPGLSFSQKQRNVAALHAAAVQRLDLSRPPLEVSTKSPLALGTSLSAFRLTLLVDDGREVSVESLYQSAKQFQYGGPFLDLRHAAPRESRGDPRLKQSGALERFVLNGDVWELDPPPSFYDWLYLNALRRHPEAMRAIRDFSAFTDIEFNPAVSLNCQARTVALAVALGGDIEATLASPSEFRARFAAVDGSMIKKQMSFDF